MGMIDKVQQYGWNFLKDSATKKGFLRKAVVWAGLPVSYDLRKVYGFQAEQYKNESRSIGSRFSRFVLTWGNVLGAVGLGTNVGLNVYNRVSGAESASMMTNLIRSLALTVGALGLLGSLVSQVFGFVKDNLVESDRLSPEHIKEVEEKVVATTELKKGNKLDNSPLELEEKTEKVIDGIKANPQNAVKMIIYGPKESGRTELLERAISQIVSFEESNKRESVVIRVDGDRLRSYLFEKRKKAQESTGVKNFLQDALRAATQAASQEAPLDIGSILPGGETGSDALNIVKNYIVSKYNVAQSGEPKKRVIVAIDNLDEAISLISEINQGKEVATDSTLRSNFVALLDELFSDKPIDVVVTCQTKEDITVKVYGGSGASRVNDKFCSTKLDEDALVDLIYAQLNDQSATVDVGTLKRSIKRELLKANTRYTTEFNLLINELKTITSNGDYNEQATIDKCIKAGARIKRSNKVFDVSGKNVCNAIKSFKGRVANPSLEPVIDCIIDTIALTDEEEKEIRMDVRGKSENALQIRDKMNEYRTKSNSFAQLETLLCNIHGKTSKSLNPEYDTYQDFVDDPVGKIIIGKAVEFVGALEVSNTSLIDQVEARSVTFLAEIESRKERLNDLKIFDHQYEHEFVPLYISFIDKVVKADIRGQIIDFVNSVSASHHRASDADFNSFKIKMKVVKRFLEEAKEITSTPLNPK